MAASGVIRVHTHKHYKFIISKNYLLESRNFILHTALMILESNVLQDKKSISN